MDIWVYFGFMYGILFADRIITRKTRKPANQRFALLRSSAFSVQPANHTETRKIKKLIEVMMYIIPPNPHTESTEINGIHEKGAGGGGMERFYHYVILINLGFYHSKYYGFLWMQLIHAIHYTKPKYIQKYQKHRDYDRYSLIPPPTRKPSVWSQTFSLLG